MLPAEEYAKTYSSTVVEKLSFQDYRLNLILYTLRDGKRQEQLKVIRTGKRHLSLSKFLSH